MGSLSNLYISQSYTSLVHLGNDGPITNLSSSQFVELQDGLGNGLKISLNRNGDVNIVGALSASNIPTDIATQAELNAYTASTNVRLNNLEAATSSYVTEAESGSFLVTGSVNINVLTFTKGDGTTFDLEVVASGSVASGTISGSAQITALGFVSSSVTASSLITASFNNSTRNLTFTKGNNTQFSVNIPDVSGSTINTGSLVTTSSFNAYTSSTNGRLNNIESTTASLLVETANLELFTQSANIRLSNLESTSASVNTSIANINLATASLNVSASLAVVTASFDNGTRNLTFTKGDTSTFAVNIPDVSGSAGNFVTTSSFNDYTSSTNSRLNNLESTTASLLIETANLESFSASALISINALNAATSSFVTEAESGSFLLTASFNNGTRDLTFTKGNNTTFAVNIPGASGSVINTGSFATTGSNTFTGNQTISLSDGEFRVTNPDFPSYGNVALGLANSSQGGVYLKQSGSVVFEGSPATRTLTFRATASFDHGLSIGVSEQFGNRLFISPITGGVAGLGYPSGSDYAYSIIVGKATDNTPTRLSRVNVTIDNNLIITGSLTSSLAQGNVWVGDVNGRTYTVPTSSFGSTINTSSFAILGANQTFTGNNTFTGNTVVSQSATFGTASFNGPVVISKGINSNVQITGSLIVRDEVKTIGNFAYFTTALNTANSGAQFTGVDSIISNNNNEFGGFSIYKEGQYPNVAFVSLAATAYSPQYGATTTPMIIANGNNPGGNDTAIAWTPNGEADHWKKSNFKYGADITGSLGLSGSFRQTGNTFISGNVQVSGSIVLSTSGSDGFAFQGKALFLTNSVQTGITVESPIHFYQVGKGDFYITNNVAGVGSGSMNMIAANNANLNISASTTIVNGRFNNNTPTASNESSIDLFKLPTFLSSNGTTYTYAAINLADYASSGIDQTFAIEYANNSFEKYSALLVGPSRTQFIVGTGTGYDYDVIELLDNNNNTTTAKVKADTIQLQGTTQITGSTFINNLGNGITDVVVTYNESTGELRKASIASVLSSSLDAAEFWSTVTQSGSAGVSGSITFNNSGSVAGISVANNSRITLSQAGTYNVQFSAQVETSAGADTLWVWFKKNGVNISDSASKVVLANNTAQIMTVNIFDAGQANDYYELAYQTLNGHARVLYEPASGNIPAIPSVILTINQIR